MPKKRISEVCKICGSPRDSKPGLFCSQCRKISQKQQSRAFRANRTSEEAELYKVKEREAKKKWYTENTEEAKRRRKEQRLDGGFVFYHDRLRKYGISVVKYLVLLTEQNHKCGICRGNYPQGKGSWHIDHDHRTQEVRGLLCHYCNTALGAFRDSPVRLNQAINYLVGSDNTYTSTDLGLQHDREHVRHELNAH